ncbi:MAG TPA: hypothetical protein VMU72_05910 [Gaiellaceae bacterium]|nr:hypothetical protein [Gaiellaceae bacterium]
MVNRRRFLLSAVLALVTLAALLAIRPLPTARALAVWILLVAALALHALARGRGDDASRGAERFEAALHPPDRPATEPAQLLRMERELVLGMASAGHASHRLLPRLRTVAAARLGSRHGIELDRRPDAARAVLGDDVWELLRPDRPEPEDRHGPGVARSRVVAVIERLEAL